MELEASEIAQTIAQLLVSNVFASDVFDFMEKNQPRFQVEDHAESKADATKFEHALHYSDVHREFCDTFETRIQQYLEEEGYTSDQTKDLLAALAQQDVGSEAFQLLNALVSVFDYECFVEVMRDKERRQYLQQITRGWASTLSLKESKASCR
mmetsp:Transcript_10452/g.19254  ORF Transcript_10452/g.19254 Transcript_10452/m.19254 type:complete len:153 (+) Transcript_10452:554-1012(+)